ncbi:predicted protein [Naegleria gruberi]|uniref:Predicted protein n=1 Tax=Naegleria gruberi TaxID=5762 RepID=D2VWH2_NAEGR|nr:uncharacterized protein NAEGRDRAFT_73379 [Naegleria gruberi]EFC38837.1 predicted protein [Naegleria gruberi]|eukprot:XP_002671581.1 predicted protein [Naegleria gruberi strain NEG-M]
MKRQSNEHSALPKRKKQQSVEEPPSREQQLQQTSPTIGSTTIINHVDDENNNKIIMMMTNIPLDIITNEVFTFFPCQWIFRVAFLVCKAWYNSVNNFNLLIIQTNLNVDTQRNQSFLLCCKEGRFNSAREFCVKGFDLHHYKLSIPIVNFTALQVLDLSYSKLGSLGISILSQNNANQLRGLRKFTYRYNVLTHKGLEVLCSLPLTKLKELDLSFNRIGDTGCTVLRKAPFLNSLTSLELYDNRIGNQGFLTLVDTNFQSLRFINLRFNAVDHIDCEVFNSEKLSNKLPNIQSINLLFNKIDISEITHLNANVKKLIVVNMVN